MVGFAKLERWVFILFLWCLLWAVWLWWALFQTYDKWNVAGSDRKVTISTELLLIRI